MLPVTYNYTVSGPFYMDHILHLVCIEGVIFYFCCPFTHALIMLMGSGSASALCGAPHLHSMWSIHCIDHIRHLVCIEWVIFWYPIHTCYVWDQAVQSIIFMRQDWCILYGNILLNFSCDIEFKFTLPNIQICY